MARFKVGDRVMMKFNTGRITRIVWNEFGYKSAEPAVVAAVDNGDVYFKYRVLLDNKNPTDYGYWWAAESELSPLAPAIPDGWTPASEPPDNVRDVRVITENGERKAWCNYSKSWRIYTDAYHGRDAAPGEVLAWREIEPAAAEPKPDAQVRYAIAYKDEVDSCDFEAENCYDTIDRAVDESKKYCRDENKPVEVWKLVAIVNPPAEPEVIRMEE